MALKESLASLKSAKEQDVYLSGVWKNFATTEAFQALSMLLGDIQIDAERNLLSADTTDFARAHAAGQVFCLRRIQATVNAAITFNPDTATYDDPPADETDEVPPDDAQII